MKFSDNKVEGNVKPTTNRGHYRQQSPVVKRTAKPQKDAVCASKAIHANFAGNVESVAAVVAA
ncbi:MAG: hypothetical protein ACRC46_01005 [Thermoguttaceae bacterium]